MSLSQARNRVVSSVPFTICFVCTCCCCTVESADSSKKDGNHSVRKEPAKTQSTKKTKAAKRQRPPPPPEHTIEPWHVVLGDPNARENRTTVATKILRQVKSHFKEKYYGKSKDVWMQQAMQEFNARLEAQNFTNFRGTRPTDVGLVLVKCTAQAASRIATPHVYGYPGDVHAWYGIAKVPLALEFFFESRDAPILENELQRHYKNLQEMRQGYAHPHIATMMDHFQALLDFASTFLRHAETGDVYAAEILASLSLIGKLKDHWKKLAKAAASKSPPKALPQASPPKGILDDNDSKPPNLPNKVGDQLGTDPNVPCQREESSTRDERNQSTDDINPPISLPHHYHQDSVTETIQENDFMMVAIDDDEYMHEPIDLYDLEREISEHGSDPMSDDMVADDLAGCDPCEPIGPFVFETTQDENQNEHGEPLPGWTIPDDDTISATGQPERPRSKRARIMKSFAIGTFLAFACVVAVTTTIGDGGSSERSGSGSTLQGNQNGSLAPSRAPVFYGIFHDSSSPSLAPVSVQKFVSSPTIPSQQDRELRSEEPSFSPSFSMFPSVFPSHDAFPSSTPSPRSSATKAPSLLPSLHLSTETSFSSAPSMFPSRFPSVHPSITVPSDGSFDEPSSQPSSPPATTDNRSLGYNFLKQDGHPKSVVKVANHQNDPQIPVVNENHHRVLNQ